MNFVVLILVGASLTYQALHPQNLPAAAYLSQLLILATPVVTIWAIKKTRTLSRHIALIMNGIIILLVTGAVLLGLEASLVAIVSVVILAVPFILNIVFLVRRARSTTSA